MPYTNSPQFQTYKSVDMRFNGESTYRSGDLTTQRDLQIVNFYYDRFSQENEERVVQLKKRPGLAATTYSLSKSVNTDVLRGSYNDADQNTFYWAVNNKVYSVKPDSGTSIRTVTTLSTSSGVVGFCSYLKGNGTRYIIFSDGTDLWVDNYASSSCNKVTDVDMPTPHQPYPLYLDGYIFLIKKDTSDIYNSDVDDPTSWTAGGVISAEINADRAIRLYKVKNYIICLGYNSIEYFWDGQVSAPSSPLQRNDSPVRGLGYVTNGCQIGDTVYFVGQDNAQNIAVYALNSFKADRISTTVVDRTLQSYSSTQDAKSNVTLLKDGYSISIDGHNFYVVPTSQTTWMYEIDEKIWYEWKGSDNTGLKIEATWPMYNGTTYCAITNQTYISLLSPTVYQDFGVNFTCRYTTENYLFGTFNWKIGHRLSLDCSKHMSTGTSNVNITYSPDDWSSDGIVGTKTINVFSNSPMCHRLGKFRNISFRFEYTDNYPFFMAGAVMDINVMGV